ncbi:MAG: hypothetical protein ABSG15_02025 [FCB group bacterium]|jgi:hypothetical protein
MKNLILAVLATIIVVFTATAQDIVDPPKLFNKDTSAVIISNIKEFPRGWNWGSPGRKLDSAMYVKYYHELKLYENQTDYIDSARAIQPLSKVVITPNYTPFDTTYDTSYVNIVGRNNNYQFNSIALHLEPTIVVDSNDNTFQPRAGDGTGAVFGFYYRDFDVGDTVTDFNRFVLHCDRPVTYPRVVLNNIWDGTILRWLDYDGGDIDHHNQGRTNDDSLNGVTDKAVYHPFNGKKFYLSINLKTMNWDSLQQHLNDTLLKIRLPYKLSHYSSSTIDSGVVKFDSIPCKSETQNEPIYGNFNNDYRGVYRKDTVTAQVQDFYITGRMLKNDTLDHNITLSAFAFFVGDTLPDGSYFNNPLFKNDWWQNKYGIKKYISKIDMEVTYYGKIDLGIDWVRLETPRSRGIFRGSYDSVAFQAYMVQDSLWRNCNPRHTKIYKFYLADEPIPMQWSSLRYLNMLMDTLGEFETYDETNPPAQLTYAIGLLQNRNGSNINFSVNSGVPYYKRSYNTADVYGGSDSTLNYNFGFKGNNKHNFNDTLNSQYETFLQGYITTIPIPQNFSIFDSTWNNTNWDPTHAHVCYDASTQYDIEYKLYHFYYKKSSLLFGNKPWWANLWVQSEGWEYHTPFNSFTLSNGSGNRPKTGEEVSVMLSEPVILGAKGLFFWYKSRLDSLPHSIWAGLQKSVDSSFQSSLPIGDSLVYSDIIGGDYIDLIDPYNYRWDSCFNPNAYYFDTLGIDQNHIYIGLKSTRASIMKINKWIEANEQKLINLHLTAWYGHGFTNWYLQDPNYTFIQYTQHFLDSIVDLNNIKTRRNGDTLPNGMPYYEPPDSSFYDIACLVDPTEYAGTDPFKQSYYVAILNRRTDPLVRAQNELYSPPQYEAKDINIPLQIPVKDSSLHFYSTAEFDHNVLNGGRRNIDNDSMPPSYWQSMWWRRQGCREIRIPLKYNINSVEDHRYTLLRVKELGVGTWLDTLWYRQAPYTHRIDTIVGNDSVLVVRLLPGEAKILHIEVIHAFDNLVGNLAYSNQRKMVAYPIPIVDTFGHEISQSQDSVRYHLVYQRFDSLAHRMKVYYARSEPASKNQHYESLDWEISDICLSDSIDLKYVTLEHDCRRQFADSMNGYYPALVIRKDPIAQKSKVYAVFCANFNTGGLTCAPPRATDTSYIIETILLENETDANLYLNKHLGTAIGRFKGRISPSWDTLSWGTPMINASSTGNYYTWSDSVRHIFAGWKRPQDTVFRNPRDSMYLCWYDHNGGWMPPKKIWTEHPSLNSYSRLSYNQEDCALVWQEKLNPSSLWLPGLHSYHKYQVHFTRLRKDENDSLVNYIPKSFCNAQVNPKEIYSSDSTVLWLPEGWDADSVMRNTYEHTIPMVYRSVASDSGLDRMYSYDRVYWNGCDTSNHFYIYHTGMDYIDILDRFGKWIPSCWNVWSSYRIKSLVYYLAYPDAAQGCLKLDSLNQYTDANDSIMTISFLSLQLSNPPWSTQIWHINHSLWGLYNSWAILNSEFSQYQYAHPLVVGNSQWPHLAAYNTITNEDDYHIGRDIFQYMNSNWDLSADQDIKTSMQYFYKKNENNETPAIAYFGFKTKYGLNEDNNEISLVTPARLEEGDSNYLPLTIDPYQKQGISFFPKDTIFSSWFNVRDIQNVEFESFGRKKSNNDLIKIKLEREGDKHRYEIPTSFARDGNYSHHKVLLMNGRNERFRFVWEKVNENSTYAEELLIGQPPYTLDNNNDTLFSRTGSYNNNPYEVIVDLNDSYDFTNTDEITVNLFPNPAGNVVNVIAKLPLSEFGKGNRDIVISMYTSIGKELQRKITHTGDILSLPLEMYSSGAYFIKAEVQPGYFSYQSYNPVLKSFVIQR